MANGKLLKFCENVCDDFEYIRLLLIEHFMPQPVVFRSLFSFDTDLGLQNNEFCTCSDWLYSSCCTVFCGIFLACASS